jgi:hypothetical protein
MVLRISEYVIVCRIVYLLLWEFHSHEFLNSSGGLARRKTFHLKGKGF